MASVHVALEAMSPSDLTEEKAAVAVYTEASEAASRDSDIGTRLLFKRIALDEQGRTAWRERRLDRREHMGEPADLSPFSRSRKTIVFRVPPDRNANDNIIRATNEAIQHSDENRGTPFARW
jgi:hypothetical protein